MLESSRLTNPRYRALPATDPQRPEQAPCALWPGADDGLLAKANPEQLAVDPPGFGAGALEEVAFVTQTHSPFQIVEATAAS